MEWLDRASQRRVHLPAELGQVPRRQFLIGYDDGQRRIARPWFVRILLGQLALDMLEVRNALASLRVQVALDDLPLAVHDGADTVHDAEHGKSRWTDLPKGAALPGPL